MRLFFSTLFVLLICGCSQEAAPPPAAPALIPQAVSVLPQDGWFELTAASRIAVENEEQLAIAELFFKQFNTVAGWTPDLTIDDSGDILFQHQAGLEVEAYELSVTPDQIKITASDEAGFFYALQSIRQLLPTAFVANTIAPGVRWTIPAVEIIDAPRFAWRGFMLDVSRHFFELDKIKSILDQMAALKLNTFHWHLTDDQGWRIEIKQFPELTNTGAWRVDHNNHDWNHNRWWGRPVATADDEATYGGFYSQEEIREIVAYAQERNITVIPEIDVPGHAQAAIAAYPEIACHPGPYFVATGGVFKDNTLCPGKEATFDFLDKVLNEVMDLFPAPYIHIGGDECNKSAWKEDPDCQQRMVAEGLTNEEELQSYFIRRVEQIINERGRQLIGWDEILEGGLAPNATVMSWRGEAGGIAAAKAGHSIIMTPNKYCYLDLKQGHTDHEPNLGYSQCLLSTCYGYNPVPESLEAQAELILGVQGNLWSESLPDWDKATYMAYPRLFAIAENAWSPQAAEDWDGFIDRLYPQLARLDRQGIRYAKSAFNVWIEHQGQDDQLLIDLHTEANGLDIRYTLDGSDPAADDSLYVSPFLLKNSALIKAAAFQQNSLAGEITEKQFYVHAAQGAEVIYHTSFLSNKDGGGQTALTDLNYASNWTVDSLWQAFRAPEVSFELRFEEAQEVQAVQLNFLQVAISGIYMPEQISLLGTTDGQSFFPLKEASLLAPSRVQGRYIHRERLDFESQRLMGLKVVLDAVNPIPAGHHRAGELSKIYLDEVAVF